MDIYSNLRKNGTTQEKCRTLRRLLRGLTATSAAELQRRAELVAVATSPGSEWDIARQVALPVLRDLQGRLGAELENFPAVYSAGELLGLSAPLTFATELRRKNEELDSLIRICAQRDVAAVLMAWCSVGERLEDEAQALHTDGSWFTIWVAEHTTDEVDMIADPEFPAFDWNEVADALAGLPQPTVPVATQPVGGNGQPKTSNPEKPAKTEPAKGKGKRTRCPRGKA